MPNGESPRTRIHAVRINAASENENKRNKFLRKLRRRDSKSSCVMAGGGAPLLTSRANPNSAPRSGIGSGSCAARVSWVLSGDVGSGAPCGMSSGSSIGIFQGARGGAPGCPTDSSTEACAFQVRRAGLPANPPGGKARSRKCSSSFGEHHAATCPFL